MEMAEAAYKDLGMKESLRSKTANAAWAVWAALMQGQITTTEIYSEPIEEWQWVAAAARIAGRASHPRRHGNEELWGAAIEERMRQCDLLRDIMGNPFHAVTVDPAWLTWRGGTIPKLSLAIYNGRRFSDLPVLADALEEAGCTESNVLKHCRRPGRHVRGCWAVDLLSKKR
jgi:hypothetical protein